MTDDWLNVFDVMYIAVHAISGKRLVHLDGVMMSSNIVISPTNFEF